MIRLGLKERRDRVGSEVEVEVKVRSRDKPRKNALVRSVLSGRKSKSPTLGQVLRN
jgi:hypothetical protein